MVVVTGLVTCQPKASCINCWADGQDPYYSAHQNANFPTEAGYDSAPSTYYQYQFAFSPCVNQPEPFTDVSIGRGEYTSYPFWLAVGQSGSLWGGSGYTYGYVNASGFSFNTDPAIEVQSSDFPMGGWSLIKLANNSG